MRFIVATRDYSGLGFAQRLEQEGHAVVLAVQAPEYAHADSGSGGFDRVGNGVVDKRPLSEMLARRRELRDAYWIWDGNHSVKENELLRREGFKVFGGGLFPDLMEHDRDFAIRYCAGYGLHAPASRRFTTAPAAIAFLESRRRTAFVLKPDRGVSADTWVPEDIDPEEANLRLRERLRASAPSGAFLLQEMKRGTEANIEVWFVHGEPRFALILLECKRQRNGDRGEMTGCALDFVFPIAIGAPVVRESVGKLFPAYRRMRYTGFGDANVIIDHAGFWLLEKCERFGYNAHPNLFWTLNRDELGMTLAGLADGSFRPNFAEGHGASVAVYGEAHHDGERIGVPEDVARSVYFWDVYKEGGRWINAGYDTSPLMIAAAGDTPARAWTSLMEKARRLEGRGLSFRTDGVDSGYANSPVERLAALQEMELL